MAFALDSVKKVIDPNEREIARMRRRTVAINALEPQMQALSDEALATKTIEFRQRLAQGATLDELLPEAFAVMREAARRVLGERHYDVQLIGGMILHEGKIAEMKTGEGKTLTATLPMYLNALPARGVHVVTTNDFLVRWQAQWMGQIFEFLGMSVGYIQHAMSDAERRAMYLRDITYVENSELGFDYLRDNMAVNPSQLRLRDMYYAIVDEADSILIDEARTPLIISGETEQESQNYRRADDITKKLLRASNDEEPFYTWDKKDQQASLTEAGQEFVERELHLEGSLVDPENIEIAQLIDNALKAHKLYERDVRYVVMEGEVVIVDEFTGHLQPGRRYADGLHQAIEAKERVYTPRVRQTVATITYQNFFRLYDKLAGMTGTAKSEEQEFTKIYGCRVVICPTNKPVVRKDAADTVFKTEEAKYRGIVSEIISCHVREQPVLVGTRSVEVSEHLAGRLRQDWLQAHVLVQILSRRVHDAGKELGRDEKDAYLAALRQPMEKLVEQARYLKRRSSGTPIGKQKRRRGEEQQIDVTLGDIVAAFSLPESVTDPANLEYFLRMLDVVHDKTPAADRERYLQRLEAMVANGMRPGDEEHDSQLNVLNAKRHEAEGTIVARAGEAGMVTIATNMAGRGVDIILGGRNPEKGKSIFPERYEYVRGVGGLHVIGTERHESRRIDDQLRGRAGRQGDPGSSRFYVSLQDELMQLFGPERFGAMMGSWPEEEAIEARLISRAIERAQEKVEVRNFGYRKNTLEYDDVMNQQRTVIYSQRRRVLSGENVQQVIVRMIDDTAERYLQERAPATQSREEWHLEELYRDLVRVFSTPPEDEGKPARGKRRGGSGIAVTLAERDLQAMAEGNEGREGVAAYLREKCAAHGTLRRNVDQDTARQMLEEDVRKTVDEVLAEFCPPGRAVAQWRLGDVVRVLQERYEGVADDLGHEGLLAIPGPDLHNEVRRMVKDVYIGRELIKIGLEVERAVRHFAPADRPVEQIDFVDLVHYLESSLHDLSQRLAVDALQNSQRDPTDLTFENLKEVHAYVSARIAEKSKSRDEQMPELDEERVRTVLRELSETHFGGGKPSPVSFVKGLAESVYPMAVLGLAVERLRQLAGPDLANAVRETVREEPEEDEEVIGLRDFRAWERYWLLSSVDKAWIHHLLNMDELRDGIHLRGHAQRDPIIEYQREAADLFEQLMMTIAQRTTQKAFSGTEAAEMDGFVLRGLQEQSSELPSGGSMRSGTIQNNGPKIGRNDPCPCGSGKKYKLCCMKD